MINKVIDNEAQLLSYMITGVYVDSHYVIVIFFLFFLFDLGGRNHLHAIFVLLFAFLLEDKPQVVAGKDDTFPSWFFSVNVDTAHEQ